LKEQQLAVAVLEAEFGGSRSFVTPIDILKGVSK
jgi:hypothetical protein